MDFRFRSPDSLKELSGLVDFLIKAPLGYPDYEDWVARARTEIELGYKHAILAFSDGRLVGDLIYQEHKQLPGMREVKNIRVHPKLRHRYFALFMLRQAEAEGSFDAIICDSRSDNVRARTMLLLAGYSPLGERFLYDSHNVDTIYIKTFDSRTAGGVVYRAGNIIGS